MVLVLLFCVALWFLLRGVSCFFPSCLALHLTWGRELIYMLLVDLFNLWVYLCAFLCPRGPRPAEGIERSGCPYVRASIRRSRLRFLSKVESPVVLMVASWYWGCISMRPAGIYKSHDNIPIFRVCWLQTLAKLSSLRFLSKVES